MLQGLRPCLPRRGHGFDRWSKKTAHALRPQSPCASAMELTHQGPRSAEAAATGRSLQAAVQTQRGDRQN